MGPLINIEPVIHHVIMGDRSAHDDLGRARLIVCRTDRVRLIAMDAGTLIFFGLMHSNTYWNVWKICKNAWIFSAARNFRINSIRI